MRAVLAAVVGITLIFGVAGRASAQGPIAYAAILILTKTPSGGLQVDSVHPSSTLAEDLCADPSPDATDLCRVVDELEVGQPAATALSRSFGAGLQDLIFAPLPPSQRAQAKFAIVADGQAGGGTKEPIVIHTLISGGEVSLDICRYTRRQEIVHVVQQRSGVGPSAASGLVEATPKSCVDVIQKSLLDGFALIAATPVAPIRSGTAAPITDPAEAEIDATAQSGFNGQRIAAYLVFNGPPTLP